MFKLLSILTFSSGVCGLAYQILYSRILTILYGDMFHVHAVVLLTFMFSYGLGSILAHRAQRWLWLIEGGIGVYSFILFSIWGYNGVEIAINESFYIQSLSWGPFIAIPIIIGLPAVLIGFSVPIFSYYWGTYKEVNSFSKSYVGYNSGAAICVLLVEFWILRSFGIGNALLLVGGINGVIGALLFFYKSYWISPDKNISLTYQIKDKLDFTFILLIAIASGINQLFYLKTIEIGFGPFHENFSIIVFMSLISLSIATWICQRFSIDFDFYKRLLPVSLILSFILSSFVMSIQSDLSYGSFNILIKILYISVLLLPSFVLFALSIPSFMYSNSKHRNNGLSVGLASFGNAIGYMVMVSFLYEILSYKEIMFFMILSCLLLSYIFSRFFLFKQQWSLILSLLMLLFFVFPDTFYYTDYGEKYLSLTDNSIKNNNIHTFKKYTDNVVVETDGDLLVLRMNGYKSLETTKNKPNFPEVTVGLVPGLVSKNKTKALVLGLGTGITASAAASVFDFVDVVEINPLMRDLQSHFYDYNMQFIKRTNKAVIIDDAIRYLFKTKETYPVIINTVTSPRYFSSVKLYTTNFFRLAKSRLDQGGIYALWIDGRVSEKGTKITLKSLAEVFSKCSYLSLRREYALIMCSDNSINIDNDRLLTLPEFIVKSSNSIIKKGFFTHLEDFIYPLDMKAIKRLKVPLNTLDNPALTYHMTTESASSMNLSNFFTEVDFLEKKEKVEHCHFVYKLNMIGKNDPCYVFIKKKNIEANHYYASFLKENSHWYDKQNNSKGRFNHYLSLAYILREIDDKDGYKNILNKINEEYFKYSESNDLISASQKEHFNYLYTQHLLDKGEHVNQMLLAKIYLKNFNDSRLRKVLISSD